MFAVRMDPYCVIQSGSESVKTKRAHGTTPPMFEHHKQDIATAITCMQVKMQPSQVDICTGGGRSPNWHQTVTLNLQPGDNDIAVQVRCCTMYSNITCSPGIVWIEYLTHCQLKLMEGQNTALMRSDVFCGFIRCSTTASSAAMMRWQGLWSHSPPSTARATGSGSSESPCSLLPRKALSGAARSSCA